MNEQPLRYLSTFTGIGGFELGIRNAFRAAQRRGQGYPSGESEAGRGLQPAQSQGASAEDGRIGADPADGSGYGSLCVGYSEVDEYAIKTYEEHFNHENYGDITAIDPGELPHFELLVGGFPCQSFSIAGKRLGFGDTRGTLFFDIVRILQHKRPRHLVLENVKGLLTHDGGETIKTILGVLADMGYRVEWMVLNSSHFGVPQNRERIYLVGHLRAECAGQVFPVARSHEVHDEAGAEVRAVAQTVTATYHKGHKGSHIEVEADLYKGGGQAGRIYSKDGISPTLSTMSTGGNQHPKITEDVRVRRLTPRECERLQGFPNDWTVNASDHQRYKQCGNAVTTNVVEAVIATMLERCNL